MRLLLLFMSLLRVSLTKSPKEVLGYLGESVTLPTGVDPSLNISTIIWSVFPNATFIATYFNKVENLRWRSQYAERLHLNVSSGDLVIHHLIPEDAMEYTVQITNTEKIPEQKVKLVVEQHLQKPKLEKLLGQSEDGGCRVALRCSSLGQGVHFSWQVHPQASAAFDVFQDGNASVIFASINNTHVNFTCNASTKVEFASSVLTESCRAEDKREPASIQMHDKHFAYCFLGFILGVGLLLTIHLLRGRIRRSAKL
ncbi:SLAM family member 5 [Genypterus blacodes]|uniref:SLAM family member 5 n=1 Tax=Genypterus blacodes TaxID=154954 RepID=UPI003F77663C